jgi:hypothetical protein
MANQIHETVTFFESDTVRGLEDMVNDFFKEGNLQIINVSYQTCYNADKKYVLHSAAIAYRNLKNE